MCHLVLASLILLWISVRQAATEGVDFDVSMLQRMLKKLVIFFI
jgi:hypothetical protein